jgi:hypothetical protein
MRSQAGDFVVDVFRPNLHSTACHFRCSRASDNVAFDTGSGEFPLWMRFDTNNIPCATMG